MTDEQSRISLLTLPAELLYRICDFLDTETILFSFRNVCKQLHAITNTYNQYKIYFHSMSEMNICRIIRPENIVSLDFWDRNTEIDWIELFLSIFDIHQFTRLRSLSLHKIKKNDLNIILRHVTVNCKLTSFAIHSDIPKDDYDTPKLLSSIIAQSTLHNLILYFNLTDKEKLSWPVQCNVEKLSIGICTIKQFCSILQNSAHLHDLIMDDCYVNEIDETILSNFYRQLTSLTLNDIRMTMDKLEFLLTLIPSLVHLDLSSSGKPFEFVRRLSQWEEFIQLKLPRLSQFEFCIFCFSSNWDNFESLMLAFRTPFWLKEKRWFVTCQFRDDWTSSFTLFTSSNSSSFSYQEDNNFDKVVSSNDRNQ
jgi:hypothetical protein